MRRLRHPGLVLGAILCGLCCRPAVCDERYWALFADGAEAAAARIEDWAADKHPRIGGRRLFDAGNPLRVLRDLRLKPSLAGPRVLFVNGDVLPGTVVAFGPAGDHPGQPDCLIVTPQAPLRSARGQTAPVLVRPECVRRVVFAHEPQGPYRPGTVLFTSGEAMRSQAVRWTPTGLRVLTDKGIRSFALDELAEVHLPQRDATRHVLNDALAPSPRDDDLVGRVTTAQGASVTFRQATMTLQRYWFLVQPVWSLEAIQVWLHDASFLSFRRRTELPLSLLPAETLQQKSFTGFVCNWRRNRNVRGDVLESGRVSCDLGIGTHSHSAVAFRLPAGARAVTFLAGLDRAVADRGCVKLKVYRDHPAGQPLWKSGFLRGGDKPVRVGPLDCTRARRLVLVTEFGHRGRPDGADPVDIRDEVNWILPTLRLTDDALAQHAGCPLRHFDGLAGWTLSKADAAKASVGARWSNSGRRWEPMLNVPPSGLTLTRKAHVTAAAPLLSISARAVDKTHKLSLSVADKPIPCTDGRTHLDTASHSRGRQWSLAACVGKAVDLSVKIEPADPKAPASALLRLEISLRGDPVLVPTSDRAPQQWRYTTAEPPNGWEKPGFDDSAWKTAPGLFGSKEFKGVRTPWQTKEIWLRRSFRLPDTRVGRLSLRVIHDDGAEVYLNGHLAAKFDSARADYATVRLPDKATQALRAGPNVLAVHCENGDGPQVIDVGLATEWPK